jgi:glyoxylase-like metal-dependent hydrolase (beta-lactamase superfamily II)
MKREELFKDLNETGYAENKDWGISCLQSGIYHIDTSTKAWPAGTDNEKGEHNNPASVYLIDTEDVILIIDGGYPMASPEQRESLLEVLHAFCDGKKVFGFLTHNHPDHIGLFVDPVISKEIPLEKLYLSKKDETSSLFDRHLQDFAPLAFVKDDDTFEIGQNQYTVLDIPGHTPGSIGLLDPKANVIFSGDAIGSGYVWMLFESSSNPLFDLERSLEHLKEEIRALPESEKTRILAGHRWQQFDFASNPAAPQEMKAEYLDDMLEVLHSLKEGTTQIVDYPDAPDFISQAVELSLSEKHAKIDTTKPFIQTYLLNN